jgi:RNA polymerase sigma-70 factor (ECF subfamily)
VEERLPERSQQATLRELGDERIRDVVTQYMRAWEDGDVPAIVALLAEDATFDMPPNPEWYRGRAAIGAFLAAKPLSVPGRWRVEPARANGQPAVAAFDAGHVAHALSVLSFDDHGRIAAVTSFLEPETLAGFGLPVG